MTKDTDYSWTDEPVKHLHFIIINGRIVVPSHCSHIVILDMNAEQFAAYIINKHKIERYLYSHIYIVVAVKVIYGCIRTYCEANYSHLYSVPLPPSLLYNYGKYIEAIENKCDYKISNELEILIHYINTLLNNKDKIFTEYKVNTHTNTIDIKIVILKISNHYDNKLHNE
jgi:hypothetical protein